MQSWKTLSASLPSVALSAASKNFRNTVQATRYVSISPYSTNRHTAHSAWRPGRLHS